MPIFPWQRMHHINVWRMVGGNMPTLTCLWLTVRVGYNVETLSMTLTGPYRTCWMFSQYCWSHERWATVPLMGAINALLPYNCTKRSPPSLFRQLHVIRFPCGREKNKGTYGYTKCTCSQSLTVLERTISDLQAWKHHFSIHVIPWYWINVGGSGHASVSSLAWTHMWHARCTRWAHRSVEEVLSISEQFVSLS